MKKIKEIHSIIEQIQKLGKKKLVMQWIRAHCNRQGNEKADMLAKKGSKIKQKTTSAFLYESIKRIIKEKMNEGTIS